MEATETLANLIRQNKLENARQRLITGEKIPKGLGDFEKSQIYNVLINSRAFDLILVLAEQGFVEADIYEYEKLEGSLFSKLFATLSNDSDDLAFLKTFIAKLENLNDAVEDNTLLGLAFNSLASIEIINVLVDAGCDVNYKNNYEYNFLHKIIQEYNIKESLGLQYLEFLIEQGLDVNTENIVGQTALHFAIDKNKKQYTELLLQNGADPNQQDNDGKTPFYIAVVHQVCKPEMYNSIKQYAPADFNITEKDGETLLLGAIKMRRNGEQYDLELLKTLIADGADVYQTSPHYGNEKSTLDWACEYKADVLEAILETGVVDINRADNQGNTLLHTVCAFDVNFDEESAKQLYKKVKLLIENGADVNVLNDAEKAPMDLAAGDNLKAKTVELLLKHKA
ncbi:ankyrin repeat domain-containing protein [Sphingobacterium deserti]|uniref:Ankyrin n=1 Tax=Sphingobacterium deserti TaxID=1229276 RepID=A0A0B8SZ05_9SPHI|nr:ankyrin repeat domain-containing protein [Sphingobacterium deserti]KGE12516.1 ankyrin [Sphingobacterium deserti]